MISLEDHTNSYSEQEKTSLICYTRLFLEGIFQRSHDKVFVNIFIKNPSDALYPETGGCTIQNRFTEYDVVVYNYRHKVMNSLSHELIHVKQFMENGFRIDRLKNEILWKHKFFMSYTELLQIHRNRDLARYKLLPWETEADMMIPAIVESIGGKFREIAKNKGTLETLFRIASSEAKFY